jgi:hypothetical protein
MNLKEVVGCVFVAALVLSPCGANSQDADMPELRKTIPTVKKSVFSPHEIAVNYLDVQSPFPAPPAPGVHPRILISPEELPVLRKNLSETACGRRAIGSIRVWLNSISQEDGPLQKVFDGLVDGDPDALKKATNSWWQNQTGMMLRFAAFDAMVSDDAVFAKKVAKALVTYADITGGKITPHGYKSVNPDASLGFSYDFLYNYMSDEQRNAIRGVIARSIAGKESHGMGMKAEERTYNWMPHGMSLVLVALAIEGEEGYEPEIYKKSVEVMRDFLVYGIYPDGVPRECMHYFNFGMGSGGSAAMVAMAKRGDNLLGSPHFNKLKNWYVHSAEPFGYAFSMHGDTSNDHGGLLDNYVLMKTLFPTDPVVDFSWRNRIRDNYSGLTYRGDFLFCALFGKNWNEGDVAEKAPQPDQWGVDNVDKEKSKPILKEWDPAKLELPLTLFSPYRGFMITRDVWDKDALVMHFECRRDALGPGHNHANQNDFTLSALGRKWVVERGFHVAETKHHSCVLIDGKGQGHFAAPGIVTAHLDTPVATFSTGDAQNAYMYRHTFPWRVGNKENKSNNWQRSPFSKAAAALENPVECAFRTAMLVRGKHPYALILDDITKDSKEHVYEWLMQVESDLTLKSADADTAVLASQDATDDSPELMVKILEQQQTQDMTLADAVEPLRLEIFRPRRSANTGSAEVFKLGKKLVLASRAVSPAFKVMLYPHRPGAEAPELKRDKNVFTINLPGQTDVYTFKKLPSGQEAFSMVRNNGEFILTAALKKYQSKTLSFTAKGTGPSVARDADTLYVSGTDWQSMEISCPGVKNIVSDQSVGEMKKTAKGYELMEK